MRRAGDTPAKRAGLSPAQCAGSLKEYIQIMSIEIEINGSVVSVSTKRKESRPMHELRIGPLVLALAPECETLFRLKARMIRDSEIQGAELLEVYFQGKEPWIFDRKLTKKEASEFLA